MFLVGGRQNLVLSGTDNLQSYGMSLIGKLGYSPAESSNDLRSHLSAFRKLMCRSKTVRTVQSEGKLMW